MAEEQNASELIPPGCGLWLGWIAASVIGATLGWFLGWRLSFSVPGALATLALGAIVGLSIGLLQSLALRGYARRAYWWAPISSVGWGVGFLSGVWLAQRMGLAEAEFGLVAGAITGAVLGICQWMALRRWVPGAGWWVPASIFAWGSSLLYYRPGLTGAGILYGLLSGLVTGTVLLWLFYRPKD